LKKQRVVFLIRGHLNRRETIQIQLNLRLKFKKDHETEIIEQTTRGQMNRNNLNPISFKKETVDIDNTKIFFLF